ncbi:MAG: RHS repeat-associated core domain-containing protein, partial [Peptococcaceae bacterium]|nr:RHS repeat-associated core domain-containing protein [Peptococcaceae bacterium]
NNPTDYLFTGKELDHTGLYYFAARYYDPSVGRFITEDPHWNAPGLSHRADRENSGSIAAMTQATNLYVYCGNNPLILVDPSGKVFTLATGLVGAVAGGIAGAIYSLRASDGRGVSWRHVAAGAAIGGAIGLTGGAATAYFTTGSGVVSTIYKMEITLW